MKDHQIKGKQGHIIGSMYPEKWTFDGTQHRTIGVNEAIRVFDNMKAVFAAKNKGKSTQKVDLPCVVALTGQFSNYFLEDLRKMAF